MERSGHLRRALTVCLVLTGILLMAPQAAFAAVSIARGELRSGQLRVEGGGALPNATVTVRSLESSATGRADGSGQFRIEVSSFRASDCKVTATDGSTTSNPFTLSGCTVTTTTPPPPPPPDGGTTEPPPPPPPSGCRLVPETLGDGNVGTNAAWFISTEGGCRSSNAPLQFSVVSGRIPSGTRLFTQGVGTAGIAGTPTTTGLFTFTLRVRDNVGASDTESYSIRINPPRPVVINNTPGADGVYQLTTGTVGQFYCCGNLFADGGVPGYTWSLRSGQIPPGLRLTTSPGRITGTPTTRGTFTFVMRATDTRGAFAEGTFRIIIE